MLTRRVLWSLSVCLILGVSHVQAGQRSDDFATQSRAADADGPVFPVQVQQPRPQQPPQPPPRPPVQPPRPPAPTPPAPTNPYSRIPPPPPNQPDRVTPAGSTNTPPPDRTQVSTLPESTRPELLGDAPPLNLLLRTPQGGAILVPRNRGFKIDDNESPRPQTRTYFTFNQFLNLNASVNDTFKADVHNINIHRETFGTEIAFCDDCFSIGIRQPTNTVSARSSTIPSLNGTHTTMGDLSVILKAVLCEEEDDDAETLLSGGLAVTPPTGAGSLFNDAQFRRFRDTTLQPYLGFIFRYEDLYCQGFSALDISTDRHDVTVWYHDVSLRYFLYWNPNPTAPITAITPIFEVHLGVPLNHHGVLAASDPAGMSDLVNLTMGMDFRFFNRVKLVLGVVTPVTGPSPMGLEWLSQFKLMY
jgi:hypothetical protein